MAKMMLTLPDEMQEALHQASNNEDRVIAAVVRRAIAEYLLKHHNITVPHNMKWGGGSGGKRSESSGEGE
jgi:hypothetical protein